MKNNNNVVKTAKIIQEFQIERYVAKMFDVDGTQIAELHDFTSMLNLLEKLICSALLSQAARIEINIEKGKYICQQ